MNNLSEIAESFNIELKKDVYLSEKTTFKVGGKARVFVEPENTLQLVAILKSCKSDGLEYFILGGGSNLVVSDEGIDKVVISTGKLNAIHAETLKDDFSSAVLSCGCGATIKTVTKFCISNSFGGLETFAGLPGTCGGAAFMNARCFNVSISERIRAVKYIASDFTEKTYVMNENDWAYKISPFQKMIKDGECLCISEVQLSVNKDDAEKIKTESEKYIQFREEKGHFKFPSAGSVFKNNHDFGKPSGQIIDECGLRGLSVGGAQVAPWHGNFIINTGNATASDIKILVEKIKKEVQKKFNFTLECEIIFTENE